MRCRWKRGDVQIPGDNPITSSEEDVLGRSNSAASFAAQLLELDPGQGLVVGVLGPWGSGKTSFVNLARSHLDQAGLTVIDFNPWMFSGAEQLVDRFFVEVAAQLQWEDKSLQDVADLLRDYGEVFAGLSWLPVLGPWVDRLRGTGKVVAKFLAHRDEGLVPRRERLRERLSQLDKPIVVVLDDVDRLTSSEIREVFKLVRLTASFPNVVYLTAFDRTRVEEALSEGGVPGRDYLEKIVQITVDLPAPPAESLHSQALKAIDEALDGIEPLGPFDEQEWPDVYAEIIRPLLHTMRDVHRYCAALRWAARDIGDAVALQDLLALEAVRVFLPDVFQELPRAVEGLTAPSAMLVTQRPEPPHLATQVQGLLDHVAPHSLDDEAGGNRLYAADPASIVQQLITRLFPAGARHVGGPHYGSEWKNKWLRERRVAHEAILRLYLERVAGDTLRAFGAAEEAWARLGDEEAFNAFLRSLEPGRLEDVIASLEVYEDEFASEHAVPGVSVLLALLPTIPERPRGMFDVGPELVVDRVVLRLLRALNEPDEVEQTVRTVLPRLGSLAAQLQLIHIVGHDERRGHGLVSETTAAEFERCWRQNVRDASAEQLAAERNLLGILLTTRESGQDTPEPPDTSEVNWALLRSAYSEVRTQSLGSRSVRREPRLAWDGLLEVCGGEEALGERIGRLQDPPTSHDADLLTLARQYLEGWRPE